MIDYQGRIDGKRLMVIDKSVQIPLSRKCIVNSEFSPRSNTFFKEKRKKEKKFVRKFFVLSTRLDYISRKLDRLKNRCDRSIRNIADDRDISSIEAKGKVAKGI